MKKLKYLKKANSYLFLFRSLFHKLMAAEFLVNAINFDSKVKTMTNKDESSKNTASFFDSERSEWRDLEPNLNNVADDNKGDIIDAAKSAKESLQSLLLASLQMQHIVVLAGSGTSLGNKVNGPSMSDLWDCCVKSNSDSGEVIKKVGYDTKKEKKDIESLLSRCEAFQQLNEDQKVNNFLTHSKQSILKKCTEFLDKNDPDQISTHQTFLHRMSRRRARDSRLKLFTTNYDLCFEKAANKQGLVALNGFSFSSPHHYDPRFFLYDIVRKSSEGNQIETPLEGVFYLYKLHGSVNWSRNQSGEVTVCSNPAPESAALIYPADGKYQQSYIQPYLELMSQYLAALRQPNTCLIVIGFGFNDKHLYEPILAAVKTNPHLRLIVVDPNARENGEQDNAWARLLKFAKNGEDVCLINASFSCFSKMIPVLKSLSPAQKISREIKKIASQK